MSNKKSKEKNENLAGFQEIIEHFKGQDSLPSMPTTPDRTYDNYGLYDFLEFDNIRLNKLDKLLNQKIAIPLGVLDEKVIQSDQELRIDQLIDEVFEEMIHKNSSFYLSAQKIWDQTKK